MSIHRYCLGFVGISVCAPAVVLSPRGHHTCRADLTDPPRRFACVLHRLRRCRLPVDRGAPPSLPPPLQPAVQPGGTKHRTPVGTTRRPPLRVVPYRTVPYRTGKGARELREDRILSYWLDPGVMTISLYGEDKPDSFHPPRCIRTVPRVLLQPAGYAVTDLCASPSVHLFLLLLAECGQDAEGLGAARGAQHTRRPPRQAGCQIHTEGARQGHQRGRRYALPLPSSPPLPNAHRQTACLCTERTQYCTAQLVLAATGEVFRSPVAWRAVIPHSQAVHAVSVYRLSVHAVSVYRLALRKHARRPYGAVSACVSARDDDSEFRHRGVVPGRYGAGW